MRTRALASNNRLQRTWPLRGLPLGPGDEAELTVRPEKITLVDDRNRVPTQAKNHRLISSRKMTWTALLWISQEAISTGYGKMGSAACSRANQRC